MDAVALLREALDPELVRMGEIAQKVLPSLDGATIGCLLSLYGVEISLSNGHVTPSELADYFRILAKSLEDGEPLPTLSRIPPDEGAEDPGF